MDVRCGSETEANRVSKNGHKEGKDSKGSEGNISTSFLKDQQGTFSASAATEDCNKSKSSSADPDYCRRILVRGRSWGDFARVGEGELRSRPGELFVLWLCLRSVPGSARTFPRLRGRDPPTAAGPGPAAPLQPSWIAVDRRQRGKFSRCRCSLALPRTGPTPLYFWGFYSLFPAPGFAAFPGCRCPPAPSAPANPTRLPPAQGRGAAVPTRLAEQAGGSSPGGRGSRMPPLPVPTIPAEREIFKSPSALKTTEG